MCKRRKSTPFFYNASVVSLKYDDKKNHQRGSVETYWTHYYVLRRLLWLGHTLRMGDERIPNSLLYSELVDVRRKRGRPTLNFKDVCKHD